MILLFCVSAVLFGAVYLFPSKRRLIFIIASFVPIVLVTVRVVYRIFTPGDMDSVLHLSNILQGLPLQMCGISAILLPYFVLTKNSLIFSLLYFFSCPGAFMTLLLDNTAQFGFANVEMWTFFIPHILYFLLPIVLIICKEAMPQTRDLTWVFAMIIIILVIVHFICLIFNAIWGTAEHPIIVNYIFTIFPGNCDTATGEWIELPILGWLFHLTGGLQLFYLLLLAPLLLAIDAVLYAPLYFHKRFAAKKATG